MTTPTPNPADYIVRHEWALNPQLPPIPLTDIYGADGALACRIEHYVDQGPEEAHAILQFKDRMPLINQDAPSYATIGLDSLSFLQDAAVNYHRLTSGFTTAGNVDPRKWYANAKEDLQQQIMARLCWIQQQNVVILAHDSEKTMEFSDELVRGIGAIGTFSRNLGRAFGEVYHAFVREQMGEQRKLTGVKEYLLQTQNGGGWGAMSLIGAPDPCWTDWAALWTGETAIPRPLQCVVYGMFGTGKSRFLTTWPKPLLVLGFDPFSKMIHYENLAGR